MADDVTLLPCKVCNSKRAVPVRYESRSYGPYWRVSCANCEYDGPARKTKEAAIAAWNACVPNPRIAALEAQLAEARDCIDLFNRIIVRAECKWKEAHPDSAFYPDVPDLILWLKEQVDTLSARRCETCKHAIVETPRICQCAYWDNGVSLLLAKDGCSRWQDKETADG